MESEAGVVDMKKASSEINVPSETLPLKAETKTILPMIGHLDNIVGDLGKDIVSSVESNNKAVQDIRV